MSAPPDPKMRRGAVRSGTPEIAKSEHQKNTKSRWIFKRLFFCSPR